MKIQSAADVIRVAESRGFKVCVNPGPPPMPYLKGFKDQATDALLAALRAWRVEVIEEVGKQNERMEKHS